MAQDSGIWCREQDRVKQACSPLFGDKCYGNDSWTDIPTSERACAAEWQSTADNLTSSAVAQLGEVNLQAHTACTARTSKVCYQPSSCKVRHLIL
jgi:hypothetical protein